MMRPFQAALLLIALTLAATLPAAGGSEKLLRANYQSQIIQNRRADQDDLSRMKNVAMVRRFASAGLLVPISSRHKYYYTRYIPAKYRYLRPWSKLFLDRLSSQYHRRFRKKLRITSTIRTIALQNSLRRRNRNAAAAYGPRRSSHLTGATLDISKRGMRPAEIEWMRRVLHSLHQKGYLYAVEEFQQPTFHIMVYKSYPRYVAYLKRKYRKQSTD